MKPFIDRWAAVWMAVLIVALTQGVPCAAAVQHLSAAQFQREVERHRGDPAVVLLDIRTPREFNDGHIEGALLLDYHAPDFVDRLAALDREKTYLIYCRSGNRSGRSLAIFDRLGFARILHLESGLIGWTRARYPLVR